MNANIALVTGANKGLGFETARQLGARGVTVFLGARDAARGQAAVEKLRQGNFDARFVPLDVTLESSVLAAADHIRTTAGRLDILVNNAGILLDDGLPSEITLDVLRRTYQTNVLGAVAVLQAMLPLLQRSQAGRIVNVSSHLASLTLNSDPGFRGYGVKLLAYNSSKTALNAVTVLFAHQLRDTAIKVNAAAPGPVATGLIDNKGARPPEEGARIVLRLAMLPPDGPTGGFFDSDGPVPW